jgi:hypothetical protein
VVAIWESQQGWKKRGSDSWEDKVGEEIDVEDWWEELGGGQTEPVRSQVREASSEGGSVAGRDTDFEGGFVTGKEDFNSITRLEQGRLRAERKKSLEEWNFESFAIAMAEIAKI